MRLTPVGNLGAVMQNHSGPGTDMSFQQQ